MQNLLWSRAETSSQIMIPQSVAEALGRFISKIEG